MRIKPYREEEATLFPGDDFKYIKTEYWTKLIYLRDGNMKLKINGESIQMYPQHCYLTHPGEKVEFAIQSKSRIFWAHLKFLIFSNLEFFQFVNAKRYVKITDPKKYEKHFQDLILNHRKQVNTGMLRAGLILVLTSPFDELQIDETFLKKRLLLTRLGPVLEYINQNYYKNIKLSELSRLAHLSENYFSSQFLKAVGTTPINYLNQKRVDEAKYLLLTTDDRLDRIAIDVGFHDSSHLSRLFKLYAGISPGQFRKLNRI